MDKINIKRLKVFAYHGVEDHEKENGQDFYIDACMCLDTITAGTEDNLDKTINYALVCDFIVDTIKSNKWNLIETVAEKLSVQIMNKYEQLSSIDITVHKPHAPINHEFSDVSVSVNRTWNICAISFGSNIGNREKYIDEALNSIKSSDYIKEVAVSSIIETKPYGNIDQDNFLNGALVCKTMFSPTELLKYLQGLEASANRKREIHWGPRTLDLDIIFFNNLIINHKDLIVPHPDMKNRDFVLTPLNEIIPDFIHPVYNKSIKQLLSQLKKND